jgi:hypothetical protein
MGHTVSEAESALHGADLSPAGALWYDGEDEIGALASEVGVFIGWVDVAWSGPSQPQPQLRDVVHIPADLVDEARVQAAIEKARARREASLRRCRLCEGRFVPGHMQSDDVCQGCAEQHLGVVH